ncbi:MAG: toprim domain-containing protein [Patescibacteria group bacterium]|nr:toprim domain-containing protein [Patescibacteria group bacterium]
MAEKKAQRNYLPEIGSYSSDVAEVLASIEDPPTELINWATHLSPRADLRALAEAYRRAGLIEDEAKLGQFLKELVGKNPRFSAKVTRYDVTHKPPTAQWSQLVRIIRGGKSSDEFFWEVAMGGSVTHEILLGTLTGEVFTPQQTECELQSSLFDTNTENLLLGNPQLSYITDETVPGSWNNHDLLPVFKQNGHSVRPFDLDLTAQLQDYHCQLNHALETNDVWEARRLSLAAVPLLYPYVGRSLEKFLSLPRHAAQELLPDLVATWCGILTSGYRQYLEKGPQVLLTEAPPFKSRLINTGRIDGALVIGTDNGQLTSRQQAEVCRVVASRPSSLVEADWKIHHQFGWWPLWMIEEVKTLVGGTVDGNLRTWASERYPVKPLTEVPKGHLLQASTYIGWGRLGLDLVHDQLDPEKSPLSDRVVGAQLVYVAPSWEAPQHLLVSPTDQEVRGRLDGFARRYLQYTSRAQARVTDQLFTGLALATLLGNERRAYVMIDGRKNGNHNGNNHPDGLNSHDQAIKELITSRQEYLDRESEKTGGIISVLGKKRSGAPMYLMDFTRLVQALRGGAVEGESVDGDRAFKVRCFLKTHQPKNPDYPGQIDRNPSLLVNPYTGSWKCFSCGAGGRIDERTLNGLVKIDGRRVRNYLTHSQAEIPNRQEIPERYLEIMQIAQNLLKERWLTQGSESDRYRAEVAHKYLQSRAIDVELATQLGVGLASQRGFAYEIFNRVAGGRTDHDEALQTYHELLQTGFYRLSERINQEQGVVPFLKKFGLTYEEIKQPLKKGKGFGLPVFAFSAGNFAENEGVGYITFPLSFWPDAVVSFYGRLAFNAKNKQVLSHVKSSGEYTHGLCFEQILEADPKVGVNICEAPLDALSAIQMGYPTVALVGTSNWAGLKHAAQVSDQRVELGLAFDRDGPGREASQKSVQGLRIYGYPGPIVDLTEKLVEQNHGLAEWKDLNDLLRQLQQV